MDRQHAAFCSEHGVNGYPTVKVLKAGGKEEKYEQARSFSAMTTFMQVSLTSCNHNAL